MTTETIMRRIALLALAAGAAGCATIDNGGAEQLSRDALAVPGVAYEAARRSLAGPQLQPVASPAALTGGQQQTMPQPNFPTAEPGAPNSLWRQGSRSFFHDARASRIGDIITVNIAIDDRAELSNTSNRSRRGETNAGITNFFGLEGALGDLLGTDPSALVTAEAESTHNGQGAINREERIELTVAAVITDRLPNGNLIIAGRQEVRINGELRELTVSGVIRPEDVTATNTVNHTQIAEARISYGGRGQVSAVQRPNWGQRAADAITPW